ncbi:MAG: superoxide dismutase [Bacteroidetes bacterium]|nr:MAG: superoxide dismutase [Bacteroidota bacterium]
MEKRTFLKTGLLVSVGAVMAPFIQACKSTVSAADKPAGNVLPAPQNRRAAAFTLPPLPYDTAALEPYVDKLTMEIHHGKHHQAYVNNLNDAVKGTVYADYELEDIVSRITAADSDKKIRNNAGGHWNHSFFWQIMSPGTSAAPEGKLAAALTSTYTSVDKFKEEFTNAAKGVFGSGWVWLCVAKDKTLFISTTPNQDNPLMLQIAGKTGTPVLGLDVWEHAYYLKHQNKRPDYISAFFNVVNWKEVGARYEKAIL